MPCRWKCLLTSLWQYQISSGIKRFITWCSDTYYELDDVYCCLGKRTQSGSCKKTASCPYKAHVFFKMNTSPRNLSGRLQVIDGASVTVSTYFSPLHHCIFQTVTASLLEERSICFNHSIRLCKNQYNLRTKLYWNNHEEFINLLYSKQCRPVIY